jgi:CMP-N,N'-diacetyllegionaminic acid synthase
VRLGIIPARGGSKGIPHKNIAVVGGRPLIAWTIAAARESARLDRVLISTDDQAIADVAREHGAEVPELRPAALSQDGTLMLPVLQHAIGLAERDGARVEIAVLLQPTSPLRTGAHIDAAVDLLTGAVDTVVSVVEVPHHFHPLSVMALDGERLVPWSGEATVTRRQDKPRLYGRNGPAVLAATRRTWMEQGTLYGRETRALVMTAEDSIDIDEPFDLELADWLLQRRRQGGRP